MLSVSVGRVDSSTGDGSRDGGGGDADDGGVGDDGEVGDDGDVGDDGGAAEYDMIYRVRIAKCCKKILLSYLYRIDLDIHPDTNTRFHSHYQCRSIDRAHRSPTHH